MIRAGFRKELENQRRTLLLVWVVMLLTILIVLWIPKLIPMKLPGITIDSGAGFFRSVIWVFLFGEGIFLFWWKNSFLSKEAIFQRSQKMRLVPNMVKGSQTDQEEALGKAVSFYFYVELLALAISESIGLFGFVLACIGAFFWDQYVLTIVSILLLIFFYPFESFFTSLIGEGAESRRRSAEVDEGRVY